MVTGLRKAPSLQDRCGVVDDEHVEHQKGDGRFMILPRSCKGVKEVDFSSALYNLSEWSGSRGSGGGGGVVCGSCQAMKSVAAPTTPSRSGFSA